MKLWKWEQKKNKEAVSFFKEFIKKVLGKQFQVVHWGWWRAGSKGYYGVSMYFKDVDESEES